MKFSLGPLLAPHVEASQGRVYRSVERHFEDGKLVTNQRAILWESGPTLRAGLPLTKAQARKLAQANRKGELSVTAEELLRVWESRS